MTRDNHKIQADQEVRAVSALGSALPITDRPIVRWQLAAGSRPSGVWISRTP